MRFWVKIFLSISMVVMLGGCGSSGGGGSTPTASTLTIEPIANQSLKEFFAPVTIQAKVTQRDGDSYHLYIESSDRSLIEANVTQSGVITLTAANKSSGVGSATITLIAFTLSDVANITFEVSVTSTTLVSFSTLDFTEVSDEAWDELAVRKVLDTFAYGGHSSDAQIKAWAGMPASSAIVQMLTFDVSNPLLSPTRDPIPANLSLEKMSEFWNSDNSKNFLDKELRKYYETTRWDSNSMSWALSTLTRGLNPFLYKLGVWESNYHMSANRNAGVYPLPMFHHYDAIMKALTANQNYESVIAQGAKNAAIAYQYGHNRNQYKSGIFRGNEDFAREYHQLFFGVLGDYNHTYHEETSIPNTARALTDMQAHWHATSEGGPDTEITFGTDYHYTADLEILHHTISGADAKEKIDAIAKVDILHSESLANLPVMIIRHFADDNLQPATIARIQSSWKQMRPKKLLPFLWAYAISTDFHSSRRYKYESTIQRNMRVANKMIVDNSDLKHLYYDPTLYMSKEEIRLFRPIHDVFGHQTAIEASDNANIFRLTYNRSAKPYSYTRYYTCKRNSNNECIKDANGVYESTWEKDWAKLISSSQTQSYRVDEVAKWLWLRFISDGLKNYGLLERAHLVALLNGKDLALFIDEDKPLETYTLDTLTNDTKIKMLVEDGAVATMDLESSDIIKRRKANRNIGRAIAFIVATPYIYAQEGK